MTEKQMNAIWLARKGFVRVEVLVYRHGAQRWKKLGPTFFRGKWRSDFGNAESE